MVSIRSEKMPRKEKRLRWMSRIGGNREIESFFCALRGTLHRGQFLRRQTGSQ